MKEALICAGINGKYLAKFLKRNIKHDRQIQQLRIEPQIKWLKRELQITHAEKLLARIKSR